MTIDNAKVIADAKAGLKVLKAGGTLHAALRAVAYSDNRLNYDEAMLIDDCLYRKGCPIKALETLIADLK